MTHTLKHQTLASLSTEQRDIILSAVKEMDTIYDAAMTRTSMKKAGIQITEELREYSNGREEMRSQTEALKKIIRCLQDRLPQGKDETGELQQAETDNQGHEEQNPDEDGTEEPDESPQQSHCFRLEMGRPWEHNELQNIPEDTQSEYELIASTGETQDKLAAIRTQEREDTTSQEFTDKQNGAQSQQLNSTAQPSRRRKCTLKITMQDAGTNTENINEILQKLPLPEGIRINAVTLEPDYIEIMTPTEEIAGRLLGFLQQQTSITAHAELTHDADKWTEFISIRIPMGSTENQIIQALEVRSDKYREEIRVTSRRKAKGETETWLIEVPKQLQGHLTTRKSFRAGQRNFHCSAYIRIERCETCQSLHHATMDCDSEPHCARSASRHNTADCRNEQHNWVNCWSYNIRNERHGRTDHRASRTHQTQGARHSNAAKENSSNDKKEARHNPRRRNKVSTDCRANGGNSLDSKRNDKGRAEGLRENKNNGP